MADSLSTTYTGRVVAVNEKGLRLEDHESWCNYSKFAVGVVAPQRGDVVTVTVDSKGFVRAIERLDGPVTTNGAQRVRIDAQTPSGPSEKDRTITRLAVLKAAAEFGASRPDLKSGDVLAIATSWERWVTSSPVVDALDEAF